jgi:small subunit ribosomal protein S20
LANTVQAKKRARQNEAHRQHNASQRSMLRSTVKKVITAIQAGQKDQAKTAYEQAVSVIDRMANKGLIHKNKAARHKSRLSKHVKELAA